MSTHAPTVIRRFVPIQFTFSSLYPSRLGMRHMQGCAQRHPEEGDLEGEQPDQARHEQDRGRARASREKPTAAQDKCRHGELYLLILFEGQGYFGENDCWGKAGENRCICGQLW